MVLLEHTLPSGNTHFDWMFERPGIAEGPLISFRLSERPDLATPARPFRSERIGDHRRSYLDYQGPVSANRGGVRRVASGIILSLDETPTSLRLTLRWDGRPESRWLATLIPADSALDPVWEWSQES